MTVAGGEVGKTHAAYLVCGAAGVPAEKSEEAVLVHLQKGKGPKLLGRGGILPDETAPFGVGKHGNEPR